MESALSTSHPYWSRSTAWPSVRPTQKRNARVGELSL